MLVLMMSLNLSMDEEDNEEDVCEWYMVVFSILLVDDLFIFVKFDHFYMYALVLH